MPDDAAREGRRWWMLPPRARELIGPALFEAAFVVLGVVLALGANEWREVRAQRQDAEAAVDAITAELHANRGAVAEALQYHGGLLGKLAAQPRDVVPSAELFGRGFVAPAQLSATAWEVAEGTGVLSHVPYPLLLSLSHMYARQHRYELQGQAAGELLYGELYRGGPDGVAANYRNLSSLIGAFAYRERELLALYDSTFAVIGAPVSLASPH